MTINVQYTWCSPTLNLHVYFFKPISESLPHILLKRDLQATSSEEDDINIAGKSRGEGTNNEIITPILTRLNVLVRRSSKAALM